MRRTWSIVICIVLALQSAGCGTQGRGLKPSRVEKFSGEEHIAKLEEGQSPVPAIQLDGASYADIGKMAGQIGFQTRWTEDGKKLLIGDHDVVWSIQAESKTAMVEGKDAVLDAPARRQQDSMLVTTQTIERLFKDEAVFTVGETEVTIFPLPGFIDPEASQAADFKDDPLDPSVRLTKEKGRPADAQDVPATARVLSASGTKLIDAAKQYKGVPYLFGTGAYEETQRFDCSSFVQHIFDKFNYSLPRTARAQATKGTYVERSSLRVGDLMFFYVPGRFKSDEQVGHVGIYMGGQKMIHSSPLPEDGVQITDINKDYWKQTFLYAKRILD